LWRQWWGWGIGSRADKFHHLGPNLVCLRFEVGQATGNVGALDIDFSEADQAGASGVVRAWDVVRDGAVVDVPR